jgi:hypothetical protein
MRATGNAFCNWAIPSAVTFVLNRSTSCSFVRPARCFTPSSATAVWFNVVWDAAQAIFERSVTRDVLPVRLLGVGATRLTSETAQPGDLFGPERHTRQRSLDRTFDAIRKPFGTSAVRRGTRLERD